MLQNIEQRVVQLEICLTKLAELKTNLRNNFEIVQREIGQVMSAEIAMIRNREAELLQQLSDVHQQKDESIANQQAIVQNAIGMCQQAIRTNQSAPRNVIENALRNADDDVRIEFEADISGSKRVIERLGNILSSKDCRRQSIKNIGITLPFVFEKYDDDSNWLLASKSTQKLSSSNLASSEWLRKNITEPEYGQGAAPADPFLEAVDDSETSSSFELIADGKESKSSEVHVKLPNKDDVLSSKFIANLQRPMKDWLLQVSKASHELPHPPVPPHLRHHSASIPSSSNSESYEFVDVITNVQNSDNKKWINDPNTLSDTSAQQKMKNRSHDSHKFDETAFVENLSELFNRSLTHVATPSRNTVDSSTMQIDVQIWRDIVNQTHANRQWTRRH